MKLKNESVEHIAKLARIKLSDEERENYATQLTEILDYVEHLNKADTKNIAPTYQVSAVVNKYRNDSAEASGKESRLVDAAPEKKDNFVKVKAILK